MIELPRAGRARREFEQFVASSVDELLRTGYLVVWDLADAEDLVQETLLRVAKRWPRVRSMEHPGAYARRILINLALDGSDRRSRRRQELDVSPLEDRADESSLRELNRVGLKSELVSALAVLPPRQRAVLVLRYYVDLPEAQVATVLGCSLGTVKSTASRGLDRLEQELQSARTEAASITPDTRSTRR
jgi:RNA polymerase sigma-70 factor (sigma-E family)